VETGELLTRWTARIAMIFYALALARRLRTDWRHPDATAAALWGVGCGVYLAHFAAAFGFYMRWSHAVAVAHTAVRSAEVVGLRFGGGIYFNYVFTAVWLVDALWMIAGRASYARRPRWYDYIVHGYMGFMALNGVIVFGPSPTREIGAVALVILLALWWRSRRYRSSSGSGSFA
jgi:MYXO-CTERM domain-containing protein